MRIERAVLAAGAVGLALWAHAQPARAEEQEKMTPDQQAIYAMGTGMARDLKRLRITPAELEVLKSGMDAFFAGEGPDLDSPDVLKNLRRFQRARIQAAIDDESVASRKFLEDAAAKPGAIRLASGLIFRELEAGAGDAPTLKDRLAVTYRGRLRDGTEFQRALDPEDPVEVVLKEAILCWQEALPRMKPGGKAQFFCPAALAYGNEGRAPSVVPGAALEFEVRLLGRLEPPTESSGASGGEAQP